MNLQRCGFLPTKFSCSTKERGLKLHETTKYGDSNYQNMVILMTLFNSKSFILDKRPTIMPIVGGRIEDKLNFARAIFLTNHETPWRSAFWVWLRLPGQVRQLLQKERPGSEVSLIQRWGMNFVAKLGQNSYPTKPERWQNSLASLGREASPRIARSSVETAHEISQVGPWGHASRILDFPGRSNVSVSVAESWEVDSEAFEAALQHLPRDR